MGFVGTRLLRYRFAGSLADVISAGRQPILGFFGHEETLVDVDFTDCRFRFVEFQRLNLDRVRLPIAEDHVVVPDIHTGRQPLMLGSLRDVWSGPRYRDHTSGIAVQE